MPALKLFISHSSRLDDVEHQYTSKDRNWNLLNNTVKAIKMKYGDKLDILVDKDGLIPGDKWEHKLNLWLAECHVAIILFSKRAIEKSDWVKKEAAILSWRAELNPQFLLIPVLLDGETTPENLAKDFFGTLKIDANQCVRNAKTAPKIVAALEAKLGKPDGLPTPHPTPLEIVQESFAQLLGQNINEAALLTALQALGLQAAANGGDNRLLYARALACRMFETQAGVPALCFNSFENGFDHLSPLPQRQHAEELLRRIRCLWVDPGAAACLPLALQHKTPLGLTGEMVMQGDEVLSACCYTLERYVERAWPGSSRLVRVPLTDVENVGAARSEIRSRYFGGSLPPGISDAMQDIKINADNKIIILGVQGAPSARTLPDFHKLAREYQHLIIVFSLGHEVEVKPAGIRPVQPPLEPGTEANAFLAERSAHTFLQQKYGNMP